jgi:flagellar biosynthesis/type III secretory pathway protein FliH
MAAPPPPTPQKQPAPAQPTPLELELRRKVALLGKALEELEVTLERERHNMAEEAIDLGLAVAEELAAGAIALEPSRIVTIVREAVELLADEREVKLRLHPNIIEELDRVGALDGFKENPRFKLRSDPTVGEAGCIVETKAGRVDARVRARLSKLRYLLSQGEGYEEGES